MRSASPCRRTRSSIFRSRAIFPPPAGARAAAWSTNQSRPPSRTSGTEQLSALLKASGRWRSTPAAAYVSGGSLTPARRFYDLGIHHFGFWVQDVDAIVERARAAGADVMMAPLDSDSADYGEPAGKVIRSALLRDPDGNIVQLDQR